MKAYFTIQCNLAEFNIFQTKNEKFLEKKDTITNIYKTQVYNSIMCGYFCNGLIDFILKDWDKRLLDYTR